MAHIVSCMLDAEEDDFSLMLNNYIAKATTTISQGFNESSERPNPGAEKQPFAWRMHQPERKYQLFPRETQPVQTGEKSEKSSMASNLRLRMKEHTLNRRRKVSIPDLGPMTTVQEVTMDSPTLPGYISARTPLHERSISAPGQSWKHPPLVDFVTTSKVRSLDEEAELDLLANGQHESSSAKTSEARQPLSTRTLAPLVIPAQSRSPSRLSRQLSGGRMWSGSTTADAATRTGTEDAPRAKTPFTPMSATLITPLSAATSAPTTSSLATPVSASVESRSSPRPWDRTANYALVTTSKDTLFEASVTSRADSSEPRSASAASHRKLQSETGSIMERGRPRRRCETTGGIVSKRAESRRSNSAERRAFDLLPKGCKAGEAAAMMNHSEMHLVQKQALQQAAKFEVLRKEDVDKLSRELRQLDERTEYLRRTYASLRAGRRNLHTRICQYLRSPRTAKFSHDSMLKQEEALAELDASIDDWITKLDEAENRRTRVRQKLLEHVAAAATLPSTSGDVTAASQSLQAAMGTRTAGTLTTPPRSPTKPHSAPAPTSSPSPQRTAAQVPSTIIEQPLFEETGEVGLGLTATSIKPTVDTGSPARAGRLRRAETIHIYADTDVYALLADVENEFSRMSSGAVDLSPTKETPAAARSAPQDLRHAQSHETMGEAAKRLKGSSSSSSISGASATSVDERSNTGSCSSAAGSPALSSSPTADKSGEIFLTSAVFRP